MAGAAARDRVELPDSESRSIGKSVLRFSAGAAALLQSTTSLALSDSHFGIRTTSSYTTALYRVFLHVNSEKHNNGD